MNLTYIRIELLRQVRDVSNIMFVGLMPVIMYLIFGASTNSASESAGHGNVLFYVMSSMAAYGAATAATSIAGTAATEAMQGWGRQVALTRQPASGFILNKVVTAIIVAAVTVGAIFTVGVFTGAKADTISIWFTTFGIVIAGAVSFAVYGFATAMLFRSETAIGVASGALVFFSFFGNLFMPLSGTMLKVAHFTPLYGYAGLVRYPINDGQQVNGGRDSPTMLIANYATWLLIFILLAFIGTRRSRSRQ